jgi:hypothetical protein
MGGGLAGMKVPNPMRIVGSFSKKHSSIKKKREKKQVLNTLTE